MLEGLDFVWISLAALAAGMINALAGGGTLVTFPVLMAVGVPSVSANITNTVALLPGYVGGTLAQWSDIRSQGKRLWLVLPVSLLGGLLGGILLLWTEEKIFRQAVPFLILLASALLAVQEPVRGWLVRRAAQKGHAQVSPLWSILPLGLAAVYGGYFGAGLSVIVLAALGLTLDETLTRLNALKQAVSLSVNLAAAIFFLFSGHVVWQAVLVMAVCALLGGWLGGKLAGRLKPTTLRWIVVGIGVIVGLYYLLVR